MDIAAAGVWNLSQIQAFMCVFRHLDLSEFALTGGTPLNMLRAAFGAGFSPFSQTAEPGERCGGSYQAG